MAAGGPVVAIAAAASLLRQPGAGALDTIWAEDGQIFLGQAYQEGPLQAFGTSYAGYYHALPRLLAALATLAPPEAAATVLAATAAVCTGLIALLVYVASGVHLATPLSRLLVSAFVVTLPLGQDDIFNSIANLHWFGLYALFWIFVWSPRGPAGRLVSVVVVVLVALSDILAVVFLPLVLVRAVRRAGGGRRERHGLVLAAALAAGLAVQFAGLLFGPSTRALDPDPFGAATGYVLRAVPSALLGERWMGTELTSQALALAAVAWLVVAGVVLLAYGRPARPRWGLAVVALGHSAALYALPVLLTGVSTARYAAAPAMLVVTALVALLQPGARPATPAVTRDHSALPRYALAALLAVVVGANLRIDNRRADGPVWSDELDRARTACNASGQPTTRIPVAPGDGDPDRPAWSLEVPCERLSG